MGRTPLDLARMTARQYRQDSVQLKQFEPNQKMEVGGDMIEERGLTRTVDFSDQSTISFNLQMSYPSTQKPPDRSMIDLLLSVGATTGSVTSPEENHIFPLLQIDTKRAATADLTYEANQTATPSSSLSKLERDCNSENYCKCYNHLDGQISKRLKDLSHTLTPQEALDLVGDMREREQFRRKYGSRILCLDGGGIRGLVSLCILQEIERRMKMSITEIFDWIVGTSTGGIIALGLCYGELNQPPLHYSTVCVFVHQPANGQFYCGTLTPYNIIGPKDSGPKSVRQLRDLYWAKKNNVFGSSSLLLKNSEEASKELESTLKEWLGEDVVMQRTSECDVAVSSSPTPKPRYKHPTGSSSGNCRGLQFCTCVRDDATIFVGGFIHIIPDPTSTPNVLMTVIEGCWGQRALICMSEIVLPHVTHH